MVGCIGAARQAGFAIEKIRWKTESTEAKRGGAVRVGSAALAAFSR